MLAVVFKLSFSFFPLSSDFDPPPPRSPSFPPAHAVVYIQIRWSAGIRNCSFSFVLGFFLSPSLSPPELFASVLLVLHLGVFGSRLGKYSKRLPNLMFVGIQDSTMIGRHYYWNEFRRVTGFVFLPRYGCFLLPASDSIANSFKWSPNPACLSKGDFLYRLTLTAKGSISQWWALICTHFWVVVSFLSFVTRCWHISFCLNINCYLQCEGFSYAQFHSILIKSTYSGGYKLLKIYSQSLMYFCGKISWCRRISFPTRVGCCIEASC